MSREAVYGNRIENSSAPGKMPERKKQQIGQRQKACLDDSRVRLFWRTRQVHGERAYVDQRFKKGGIWMERRFEGVVAELRREAEKMESELHEIGQRKKTLEAELKRVQGALQSLGVKPERKSSAKKPSPTKNDVAAATRRVLTERAPLAFDELKSQVGDALVSDGKTKMGLALRLKEVLQDGDNFVDGPGGWRVREVVSQR